MSHFQTRGGVPVGGIPMAGQQKRYLYRKPEKMPTPDIGKIKLAPGVYLIRGQYVGQEGEIRETKGRLFIPINERNAIVPSVGEVLAKADAGCEMADVGWFVAVNTYGGNEHDDKKPTLLARWLDDDERLMLVREQDVKAALPPATDDEKAEMFDDEEEDDEED